MFSVELYCVLVEGDIMGDNFFVGIVNWYEIDRKTYSRLMKL